MGNPDILIHFKAENFSSVAQVVYSTFIHLPCVQATGLASGSTLESFRRLWEQTLMLAAMERIDGL